MNHDQMIALDLGGTDLKSGLVDKAGALAHFMRRPSRTLEDADAPLEVIMKAAEELLGRAGGRVAGAGLGSPGVIHPMTGALVGRTPHLPHWNGVALRELLAARLALPVSVD